MFLGVISYPLFADADTVIHPHLALQYDPCSSAVHGIAILPLQWRHNEGDGVSNHQPHDCLLKRLFGRRSKKTSKLRINGLYVGNSPVTGEFPTQRASKAENVSVSWRHHGVCKMVVSVSMWFSAANLALAGFPLTNALGK